MEKAAYFGWLLFFYEMISTTGNWYIEGSVVTPSWFYSQAKYPVTIKSPTIVYTFCVKKLMSKATDKVLYLCLLFFLGHTSILNH